MRYFLIAGLFFYLLWGRPSTHHHAQRLASKKPSFPVVRHEIFMSLLSSIIYAIPGVIVIEAWKNGETALYNGAITSVTGFFYIPISILIYMFIHDTYFYWTHRAMHSKLLFKATHFTHHKSRHPTPWAAFSFHPWEAIISAWPLPLLAFFLPIHIGAVFTLLIIMTYCSVANHAGWEIIPRQWLTGNFGNHFISASHHHLHHTNYQANFGLYFRFWDQVAGTDRGLAPFADIDHRSDKPANQK